MLKRMMIVAVMCGLVALATTALADSGVWDVTTGGDWSNSGNWVGGTIAGLVDQDDNVADFSQRNITANPQVVVLDTDVVLGSILIGQPSGGWNRLDINADDDETITLRSSTGTSSIEIVNSNLNYGANIRADILGTDHLNLSTVRTDWDGLSLFGNSTYSGGTTITGGYVRFGTHSVYHFGDEEIISSAVGTGTLTLQDGAMFGSRVDGVHIWNPVEMGGNVRYNPAGDNAVILEGPVTLTSETHLEQVGGGYRRLELHGDISEAYSGTDLTITGSIRTHGDLRYAMRLHGDHSHTGTTTVAFGRIRFYGDNSAATGDFVVQPGARAYMESPDAISDLSSVFLEYDPIAGEYGRLFMNQDVTVRSLYLDDVFMDPGTYGATGSGAEFVYDDYFAQTGGVLTVLTGPMPIPEPAGLSLLGMALLGLKRKRRR